MSRRARSRSRSRSRDRSNSPRRRGSRDTRKRSRERNSGTGRNLQSPQFFPPMVHLDPNFRFDDFRGGRGGNVMFPPAMLQAPIFPPGYNPFFYPHLAPVVQPPHFAPSRHRDDNDESSSKNRGGGPGQKKSFQTESFRRSVAMSQSSHVGQPYPPPSLGSKDAPALQLPFPPFGGVDLDSAGSGEPARKWAPVYRKHDNSNISPRSDMLITFDPPGTTVVPIALRVFKVGSHSVVKSVAGSIAHTTRRGQRPPEPSIFFPISTTIITHHYITLTITIINTINTIITNNTTIRPYLHLAFTVPTSPSCSLPSVPINLAHPFF